MSEPSNWTAKGGQLLLFIAVVSMCPPDALTHDTTPAATLIVNGVVRLQFPHQQAKMIKDAERRCLTNMTSHPRPIDDGVYCNRTWDGVMCWPDSPAHKVAVEACPDYINGFNVTALAYRRCQEDGTWFTNPTTNSTWTDFSGCVAAHNFSPVVPTTGLLEDHLPRIRIISVVGYGLSLVALLVAVLLMLYFKKLHCPRNTLHINLFISFILRAAIAFIKQNVMIGGIGLSKDIEYTPEGIVFIEEGLHWECKLLSVISVYLISANCLWVFVEGLYLHMLIFMSVFSEKSNVRRYIALGWLFPMTFMIPWVAVRAVLDDYMCWTQMQNHHYMWIIHAPITVVMAVNCVFFLNIVRVLFTKLRASNTPEARKYRYRKLAKSTLVLIPLFGVHNMVFIWYIPTSTAVRDPMKVAWLYYDMTFNSFQGFCIAMLFCFFNGEVQGEVRKKWHRYKLRRGSLQTSNRDRSFLFNTSTTVVTRNRNSIPSDKLDATVCGRRTSSSSRSERNSQSPPRIKLNGILKSGDNRVSSNAHNDYDSALFKDNPVRNSDKIADVILEESTSLIESRQAPKTDSV